MVEDGVAVLLLEGYSSFEMAAICDCLAEARSISGSRSFRLTVCARNERHVHASDGVFSLGGHTISDVAPRKMLVILLGPGAEPKCDGILRRVSEDWCRSGSRILLVSAASNVRRFWHQTAGSRYQAANVSRYRSYSGVVEEDVEFVTGGLGLLDELLDYVKSQHSVELMNKVSGRLLHRRHTSATSAKYLEQNLRESLPWVGPLLDAIDKGRSLSPKRQLSGAAGVSDRQLERICRNNLKMSPMEFWNFIRLHRAHSDIVASLKSIGEIAREAGYQSQSQFSKSYRKRFGTTPLAARQQALSSVP
jgi:transcriptional regulator GlxA family with amidase domain